MNGVQLLVHSAPCLPRIFYRNVQVVSPSYAQNKAQMDHPQRISWVLVHGYFEHYMYHVMVLGWSKKEERKEERKKEGKKERMNKMNNAAFRLFQVPTRLAL